MRRKSTTSDDMCLYIAYGLLALMEKQEYASITIQQIVAKAGVNRSTYYRHFSCKEDIIQYYFHHIIQEYLEECTQPGLTFPQFVVGFFTHLLTHKKQILVIHKSGQSHLLHDVYTQLLTTKSEKNRTAGEQYRTHFQIGGSSNLLLFWFSRGMVDSPEQMSQYIMQFLPANYDSYLMPTEVI